MVSVVLPKRKMGFNPPALMSSIFSDESESETGSAAYLRTAVEYSRKDRLRILIGTALQLNHLNSAAVRPLTSHNNIANPLTSHQKAKKIRAVKTAKSLQVLSVDEPKDHHLFRRKAKVVLRMIQVCSVCQDLLTKLIRKEPWFALIDNTVATSSLEQKRKGPRAFVTFVPNERRELEQLTFDMAEFKRDRRTKFLLTDSVRQMMSILPGERRPEHILEILRCLKALSMEFSYYPLSTQKQICQLAFYDRYRFNRVILRKGHRPDGIYFVLSGQLIEKNDAKKQPREILAGEKFGENDLLCGNRRRHTVLTRTDTELFYLHKQDYRKIFDMSEDANNIKHLEICRQHIVFQHFPMQRLVENPGVWSVIYYKYGQLIAMDGNEIDWIYVIKSGEARVLKYLQPGNIDVKARRRKVQAMLNSQSPFYQKRQLLSFVENRDYIKTAYRPSTYRPPVATRLNVKSAPSTSRNKQSQTGHQHTINRFRAREGCTHVQKSSVCMRTESPEFLLPRLVLDDAQGPAQPTVDSVISHAETTLDTSHEEKNSDGPIDETPRDKSVDDNADEAFNSTDLSRDEQGSSYVESGDVSADGDVEADRQKFDAQKRTVTDSEKSDTSVTKETDPPAKKDDISTSRNSAGQKLFRDRKVPDDAAEASREKASVQSSRLPGQDSVHAPPKSGPRNRRGRRGSFLKTPLPSTERHQQQSATERARWTDTPTVSEQHQTIRVGRHALPAFVQVETLHPGQVFGLRACLDPEERGPSVSLVSGDCEVLQINKKFFMRHCDDAIYGLIQMKNKPFPTEEDLIDRLDVNMQWEEYKQQTLDAFIKLKSSSKR